MILQQLLTEPTFRCAEVVVDAVHLTSENLFSIQTLNIYATPEFGRWNDSAADGSRMFLRDVSTEDMYALDVDK